MELSPRIWLILCIAIIAIPIFGGLDKLPIQLWDESRLAVNSYEMYKSGNWMVSTFHGEPDLWNTKPPLLLWFQVISFKLFGVNELALRLPSAIAGALTCLIIYWFFARRKQYSTGVISVLVLITSMGFIKYHHSPRSGDYDALLTLFTTSYCILYFLYLEEEKRSYLGVAILLMLLAAMTKASAGIIFIPALAIYTVFNKKLRLVLKEPMFYIGMVFFFLGITGYYLVREQCASGYIEAAKVNDWFGRFTGDAATPQSKPLYYFDLLIGPYFSYWYVLLFCGVMLGVFSANRYFKNAAVYFLTLSLFFFLIITNAATKNDWYDMPMYPLISMITGIGIASICGLLRHIEMLNKALSENARGLIFLLAVCMPAYIKSVNSSLYPHPGEWISYNTNMCMYLKDVYQGKVQPNGEIVIVNGEYSANIEWYSKVIRDKKGTPVKVITFEDIRPTQKIIAFNEREKKQIEKTYNYNVVENLYNTSITIYQLNGKR